MRDPNYRPVDGGGADLRPPGAEEPPDITRDTKGFTAAIRTRLFAFLRAWLIADDEAALSGIDVPADAAGAAWTADRLRGARDAYRVEHGQLRLDPEARNLRHTYVQASDDRTRWRVQQMLIDPNELNDWVLEVDVDLAASREVGGPVIQVLRLGSLM